MQLARTQIAAAIVLAGILLAAFGLATNTTETVETPATRTSAASVDAVHGLASIEDVIDTFTQRIEGQPLDYLNRTQLGVALLTQAREHADLEGYAIAEQTLRDALERNPTYPPARLSLASSLIGQHRFSEALTIATDHATSEPDDVTALALQGDASLELGRYDLAADAYARLIEIEPGAPSLSRLARFESVRGNHRNALAYASEALEASEGLALRPNTAAFYWFQLGHAQFTVGDADGAIASLAEARRIDPDHAGATEKLAFVLAATGDDARAAELYASLIESGPAADLHGSYAEVLDRLGHGDLADVQEDLGRQLADETIDRFPAERRHLVGFYLGRDVETAVQLATTDLAERQDAAAYDTLAWALFHAGDSNGANDAITRAFELSKGDAAMRYHGAAIAAAIGDTELAIARVSSALDLNPHFDPTEAADARALLARLSE